MFRAERSEPPASAESGSAKSTLKWYQAPIPASAASGAKGLRLRPGKGRAAEASATSLGALDGLDRAGRSAETRQNGSVQRAQGQRSARLKVIASKGRMLTGSSSFAVAMSTHSPSRSSKASRVRSVGSTSHRWPTPASA